MAFSMYQSHVDLLNAKDDNETIKLQGQLTEANLGEIPKEFNRDKRIGDLGAPMVFTGFGNPEATLTFESFDEEWQTEFGRLDKLVTFRVRGLLQDSLGLEADKVLTCVMKGRAMAVPLGDVQAGDPTSWEVKLGCLYVRQLVDNREIILYDTISRPNKYFVNGVDQLASLTALGV